ncbi:hypothetical protein BH09PSE6_BH09PSE6_14530 [soil metagenome]
MQWSRRQLIASVATALLCSAPAWAHAGELEGVHLPDSVAVGGQALLLNGMGARSRFGIKVYVAGLYAPARASEAAALIAQPGPKRICFVVRYSFSGDTFADAFIEGIRNNAPEAQWPMLKDRMDHFAEAMRSVKKIREGDRVTIDYLPAEGTLLQFNDRMMGNAIPGEDFQRAVLGIFLGEKPVQDSLKNALLGKR